MFHIYENILAGGMNDALLLLHIFVQYCKIAQAFADEAGNLIIMILFVPRLADLHTYYQFSVLLKISDTLSFH